MLDDAVIHVGDVERPVGPDTAVDRPEPLVGRRQELLFIGIEASGSQVGTAFELQAADEMTARFRNEDIAVGIGGELMPVVEAGAGHDGVGAEPSIVAQLERPERDSRCDPAGKHVLRGFVHGKVEIDAEPVVPARAAPVRLDERRVALHVLGRDQVADECAILARRQEPSFVVEGDAELAAEDGVVFDEAVAGETMAFGDVG